MKDNICQKFFPDEIKFINSEIINSRGVLHFSA